MEEQLLTLPRMSDHYLRVPNNNNQRSVNLNQRNRHTFSYLPIDPGQNERTKSNLSLHSTTSSILKRSSNSGAVHRRDPNQRHSVHYMPFPNELELDIVPSLVVPTTTNISVKPPSPVNTPHPDCQVTNYQYEPSEPVQHWGLRSLFRRRQSWPNPFVQGRNNDENADAYKIFSILYGLVVFIGGVAFSISHAIIPAEEAESIKHLAEIYFTYLYWVSIFWICFCIVDIVRHRQKININKTSITKFDLNHLPMSNDNRMSRNKHLSTSGGPSRKTSNSPYFNLQLFDDSDEYASENEERPETGSNKATRDDRDDNESFNDHRGKSKSLDNISMQSSAMITRLDATRDVLTRRRALDPGGVHNLRSYVRHRKDSIVQRVIGYNYDDHSTAGGLYIRVGIGIFCLGTVIHSGLSILSNLENLPCIRWTAVIDDFSRLLFSFIQFFFIFKHSNLIIRAHESFARLAVIHIVVTNLCVWFRMVVIETKSQIIEMGAHEMTLAQQSGTSGHIGNGSHNPINTLYRLPATQTDCSKLLGIGQPMTSFINEGYMKLKPLLYPCTIEFSLMCLTLFFLIWENIGKTFAYKMSDKASTKNVFMVNCHASIKGLFAGMVVFSCTVISIILYAVFRNKIGDDFHFPPSPLDNMHDDHQYHPISTGATTTVSHRHHLVPSAVPVAPAAHGPFTSLSKTPKKILYSIAIVEIVNLCLLTLSLLATTLALIKIRKLHYRRTTTRFDDVLIIVSLTGIYLYSIFSAFAIINNKNSSTWIAYVKVVIVILEFIEGTVHAFFILIALRKRLNRTSKHEYPAREIITLLIIIDLSLWFEETTTTTKHEANPFQLAFYHIIPWSIIAAIATPLQIFFRFHASVCLSHVWENMYVLPAYEAIAAHSL